MGRPSHREKILCEGLKVVHEKGFAGASVRDIVRAAGVPQGSFTNHFASKEAFGLEVLNRYVADSDAVMDETLRNADLPPFGRLDAYIARAIERNDGEGMRNGCMIGNFSAEVCEGSDVLRERLVQIYADMQAEFASVLEAAVEAGELPKGFDVGAAAEFIVSGLQGATLLAKARRDTAPLESFREQLFKTVLR
ncbi:TetR family transcriptional regulator C-terminal domain-containing protein [Phenylobacterium sp. VNQ135]|uniref:TetR/AcrR family transcriptional regulator n=1 Tax=Phenylobacterium sp. VNQ135 TaxID=3400922 RepID=UPI003BFC3DF8